MPKLPEKPRLHNRQSGTVNRGKVQSKTNGPAPEPLEPTTINDIRCVGEVVPIDSLLPDPNNARLHPDRNMEAIKQSLVAYGQMAPLVVRKQTRMIAAGNGRWQGMKELGWTSVAVSMREMTEAEFAGYALADNRTAELAKWDFEVVARLDRLLSEQQHMTRPGWSSDELEVLRIAEWTPPPISEDGDEFQGMAKLQITLTPEQKDIIDRAVALVLARGVGILSDAECLEIIVSEWLESR